MKKRHGIKIITIITIIALILIVAIVICISRSKKENEIAKVKEYNYFVLKQNNLSRSYR